MPCENIFKMRKNAHSITSTSAVPITIPSILSAKWITGSFTIASAEKKRSFNNLKPIPNIINSSTAIIMFTVSEFLYALIALHSNAIEAEETRNARKECSSFTIPRLYPVTIRHRKAIRSIINKKFMAAPPHIASLLAILH